MKLAIDQLLPPGYREGGGGVDLLGSYKRVSWSPWRIEKARHRLWLSPIESPMWLNEPGFTLEQWLAANGTTEGEFYQTQPPVRPMTKVRLPATPEGGWEAGVITDAVRRHPAGVLGLTRSTHYATWEGPQWLPEGGPRNRPVFRAPTSLGKHTYGSFTLEQDNFQSGAENAWSDYAFVVCFRPASATCEEWAQFVAGNSAHGMLLQRKAATSTWMIALSPNATDNTSGTNRPAAEIELELAMDEWHLLVCERAGTTKRVTHNGEVTEVEGSDVDLRYSHTLFARTSSGTGVHAFGGDWLGFNLIKGRLDPLEVAGFKGYYEREYGEIFGS